mmetsp:Transcript_9070/g.35475  ORF Transcript_9070/g.35475 Transcript_9070/m.35475 type:complete len:207 (+) Transcript_9070:315-935(+)
MQHHCIAEKRSWRRVCGRWQLGRAAAERAAELGRFIGERRRQRLWRRAGRMPHGEPPSAGSRGQYQWALAGQGAAAGAGHRFGCHAAGCEAQTSDQQRGGRRARGASVARGAVGGSTERVQGLWARHSLGPTRQSAAHAPAAAAANTAAPCTAAGVPSARNKASLRHLSTPGSGPIAWRACRQRSCGGGSCGARARGDAGGTARTG